MKANHKDWEETKGGNKDEESLKSSLVKKWSSSEVKRCIKKDKLGIQLDRKKKLFKTKTTFSNE